jgi:hypothetical protein
MDGETVVKVKCRTCGRAHKFRDPSAVSTNRQGKAKQEGRTKTMSADRWETAVAESKGKMHPYSMETKYRVGDIVLHDRFGKGVVLKLYANKCDVLFQDQERLMASGN